MHSDRHGSMMYAAMHSEFLRRKPVAGDSQGNGAIEALNRSIEEGARAYLAAVGLPICWWDYAVKHWCFLRNTDADATGVAPYERTRLYKFGGTRLPFGLCVFLYPNKTKYNHQHKFQSRLSYGILVGYGVEPGNNWDGTYLVIDLDGFDNKSLDDFTDLSEFVHVTPHATKVIKIEAKGYRFPLLEKYEKANLTFAGREEFYNDTKLDRDEISDQCYTMKKECNRPMRLKNPEMPQEE